MSDTKFLEEVNEEQKLFIANLRRLLDTGDEANCKMAVEIMKGGGVPVSMYEDILVYSKTLPQANLRALMRKLLEKQGVLAWENLIGDTTAFVNIETAKEKDIREKMAKMSKSVGLEETALLGYMLFKRYRKGLSFILTYRQKNPYRLTALELLTQGDTFDLHTGIGYHNWKNDKPESIILSKVDTKVKFPSDHPRVSELRVLNFHNCKFKEIPDAISAFENVEEMDLSVNNLVGLPAAFASLTKLRKLDLSSNRLTTFPQVLLAMPQLKELDLRYNDNNAIFLSQASRLLIPDDFYVQVPDCKVLV